MTQDASDGSAGRWKSMPQDIVLIMSGAAGLTILLGFAHADPSVGWILLGTALGIKLGPPIAAVARGGGQQPPPAG